MGWLLCHLLSHPPGRSKNLEILSFPSFCSPLLSTLENKALSPHQARWKGTLSQPEVFPNSRNKKRQAGRDERESCSGRCMRCVNVCVKERGWVGGFMSFHHFPPSSKSNYFSLSFPSWKIEWQDRLERRYWGNCANRLIDIMLAPHCHETRRRVRLVRLQGVSEPVRWTKSSRSRSFDGTCLPLRDLSRLGKMLRAFSSTSVWQQWHWVMICLQSLKKDI